MCSCLFTKLRTPFTYFASHTNPICPANDEDRNMAQTNTRSHTPSSHRQLSVYFIAGIAALGGLLFGYDTGVISGALLFLKQSFALDPTQQEIATSSVLVGAILGALAAGRVNDAIGRKKTLLTLAVIFTVGALLTAIAPNFILFLLFRVIVGIAIGAAASVVPVYSSEIAPSRLRGTLVTFNQLAVTVGIAVSYWVDLAYAHAGFSWQPMFATAAIPSVLLFFGMLISPETPRWLAHRGQWDDAHRVLERIQGADPEKEIQNIRASFREEKQQAGLRELLRPGIRMALIVGIALAVFQQFVGVNTIIYYAPTIFQRAGFASANTAILATSVVGVVNVIATAVAVALVDRVGRRPLLIIGSIFMVIALIALGIVFLFSSHSTGTFTLIALMVYIIAFAISFGPVFWVMSAEIFPTRARAAGSSTSTFFNWVANFLVSVTYLSLVAAIGITFTFWIYAVMGVLALLFCLRYVPETKGKTLEQIEHYWQNGHHWEPDEKAA
jgi:SP family galactose:H+ symporter-like MFS transporter